MKSIFKKSYIAILAVMGIGVFVTQVSARPIAGYDVTIPRFGNINTGRLVKEGYTNAVHRNNSIGGNKRINTSIKHANTGNDITGSYSMGAGDRIELAYNGGSGAYVNNATTLSIATPATTVVKVQAQGSWSPDAQ
ncbi:hypothetical protein [Streptococcus iniae]|uniref:Uncharacterized protein n=1 Tax=Streptococcus iniae TaxID=1346 RepID=A0A3L8GPB4_STRIN|nr:hypothetical protein [Streptococcus iniae]AGM98260.1 hypothetical protein K710_0480 [Streptococcus iniae SF1]AJG25491.1 hypothetical protein SI82_02535 [Streptococcus iniae]APD31360.1 hypothetical protein BMF34_02430 [Streptococcus iniae]ASL34294.1 hypothetical protein QMA0248_0475 [Streptococcus iniae]ATX39241.1 hypothetical protein CTW00_01059 [Streptococcus iniae]